jgi:hypothetical protein
VTRECRFSARLVKVFELSFLGKPVLLNHEKNLAQFKSNSMNFPFLPEILITYTIADISGQKKKDYTSQTQSDWLNNILYCSEDSICPEARKKTQGKKCAFTRLRKSSLTKNCGFVISHSWLSP